MEMAVVVRLKTTLSTIDVIKNLCQELVHNITVAFKLPSREKLLLLALAYLILYIKVYI